MLLSLLKILFFFAVALALALGAVYLSEHGEMLRIEYAGTEYALTPVKALVALLVLMVLAWVVFKILGLALAFLRFLAREHRIARVDREVDDGLLELPRIGAHRAHRAAVRRRCLYQSRSREKDQKSPRDYVVR